MPTIASLPSIQAMARVLSIVVELAVKVAGETISEVGGDGGVAASALTLLEVVYLSGVLPMAARDSSTH